MNKILCVHQGYELYGSDRSFIQSIEAMRARWPQAYITAVIPQDGPIMAPLAAIADKVKVESLWVPRKNRLLALFTIELLRFPIALVQAYLSMSRQDLVYINTLTILNYNIAARFSRTPSIIHVREIVGRKASCLFSSVLRFSRSVIIYNSRSTAAHFTLAPGQPVHVLYNGVGEVAGATPPEVGEKVKFLAIGRFNSWKGQDILVDAVAHLPHEMKERLEIRLVGGVFEDQDHFVESIRNSISLHGLDTVISIHPFVDDPSAHYRWADVVVVPSKKPEPFGRVAIEAMSFMRPVMAADHGGLSEIVTDGESGWLFTPNSEEACAATLKSILSAPGRIRDLGVQAQKRFMSHFSERQYKQSIGDICSDLTK